MFDTEYRSADDARLISAITEAAVAEAAAAARRLSAVAELVRRRCGDDDRAHWACDAWDAAATELSAALGVSHSRASGQMHLGTSLRSRLPLVAALFADGLLNHRVVAAIASRTDLVQEPDALATIDAVVAGHAGAWGSLSDYKLEQAIDTWIDRYDPGALRRTRANSRSRDVQIGGCNDESGTSSLWGRLYSTDARLLERRLTQMAHGVCDDDPRTTAQRRADALGALAAGCENLACRCGSPICGSSDSATSASAVIIHVLADADALQGNPDPHMSGEAPSEPFSRDMNLVEYLRQPPRPEPEPTCAPAHGVVLGGGFVPGPLLAELIRSGATVRHLRRPAGEPVPGYRPSTALDEFVRMRDLTCRFPNCDRPAEACDIDHAVAWPLGPTHPSQLRCLCRKHHLLKTFWEGWSDRQFPDGTIVWTSPTGHTYTTYPGSRLLFPQWDTATGELPDMPAPDRCAERGLMMPTRRRTRAADRAHRIRRERALNDAHVAERNQPPPF